jgi:hypothetical protein
MSFGRSFNAVITVDEAANCEVYHLVEPIATKIYAGYEEPECVLRPSVPRRAASLL